MNLHVEVLNATQRQPLLIMIIFQNDFGILMNSPVIMTILLFATPPEVHQRPNDVII
jgi:hypothetical protein